MFAVLLAGGFWLIYLYIPYPSNADLIAALVAFVFYFAYCLVQVPDKILVARICAMRPFFAESREGRRLSPNEVAAFAPRNGRSPARGNPQLAQYRWRCSALSKFDLIGASQGAGVRIVLH